MSHRSIRRPLEDSASDDFLKTVIARFRSMKSFGDRALAQLTDGDLNWRSDGHAVSIGDIVHELHAATVERWRRFLPSRDSRNETAPGETTERDQLFDLWEDAWRMLFAALDHLSLDDLRGNVVLSGETISAVDAIHRQLAQSAFQVGQIIALARQILGEDWPGMNFHRGPVPV